MAWRPGGTVLATGLLVVVVDQAAKAHVRGSLAVGESRPLIEGFLDLTHVTNTGAAFGMLPGRVGVFIATSLLVLAAIGWVFWRFKPEGTHLPASLGLVAGGAVGNLIDRVVAGRVTDFFDLGWFPVFNIADIALDVGVGLLVVWLLFGAHEAKVETIVGEDEPERPGAHPDRPESRP